MFVPKPRHVTRVGGEHLFHRAGSDRRDRGLPHQERGEGGAVREQAADRHVQYRPNVAEVRPYVHT